MTDMTFPEITHLPKLAADYMAVHGWIQGAMEQGGAVCLTGALRASNRGDAQPGDWAIARSVFRARKRGEGWNDDDERTQSEVEAELRDHPIYDADLIDTFGPQWREIVALVRRAAVLTGDEVERLDGEAVSLVAGEYARISSRYAAYFAADRIAALGSIYDAVVSVISGRCDFSSCYEAALALVARDLIGQHPGWDQAAYDLLSGTWRRVIGPIHPDDEELR